MSQHADGTAHGKYLSFLTMSNSAENFTEAVVNFTKQQATLTPELIASARRLHLHLRLIRPTEQRKEPY